MFDCQCPLKEAARDAPQQTALIAKDVSLSFSQLDQMAGRYADALHSSGLEPGERVAVFHPTDPRLIALFFAVWRLGGSICPLSLRLPPAQIERSLSRLSPSLYLTDLNSMPAPHRTSPSLPISLFLFTSGTTGQPKIALLSLESLLSNAIGAVSYFDLRPGDQWLLSLPLFHVGGIGILLRCVLARAAVVLDERSPGVTHLSYVPAQLYRAWPIYRNLRCLMLGGAPIHSIPPQLPIYASYGLTEMGSVVAAGRKSDSLHLLPNRELKLAEDGEILVRGKSLFQGYWEEGKIYLPTDQQGWFATKDMGRWTGEGIAIVGRKDWQFISGGENIQPEEIEQMLLQLPEIAEAVVVPLYDAQFGERPAAIVRTNGTPYTLEQMQSALHSKIAKFKIPIALWIWEEIPKIGEKIDRKKIFETIRKKLSKN